MSCHPLLAAVVAVMLAGLGCSNLEQVKDDELARELSEQMLPRGAGLLVEHNPGFAPANVLVVRMPDGTLVVCSSPYDTDATRAMVRGLRRRFKPPRIVAINVHFHPDGTAGNDGFAREGVETYGSDLTAATLARRGAEVWKQTAPSLPAPARSRLMNTSIVAASRTFPSAEGLRLTFGGESVQVIYPGPGHSPDNVVVYFPARKLLFGGDLIRAAGASAGYRGDADLSRWPASVEIVSKLAFDIVIPGHGRFGGRELLQHTLKVVADATARR